MKQKLYGSSSRAVVGAVLGTVAIALAAPAHAQEDTTSEDGARRLQAVIVQSTKRDTTLQDAPISIGVVTGETIADYQVADLTDLQNFVPNLTVQKTFGSWAVRIRGLGSGVTNIAFDSSVSIFNDGVYCGRLPRAPQASTELSSLPVKAFFTSPSRFFVWNARRPRTVSESGPEMAPEVR